MIDRSRLFRHHSVTRPWPLCCALLFGLLLLALPVFAEERDFNIPAQPLNQALIEFATQAGVSVNADPELLAGRQSSDLAGRHTEETALDQLLNGTGLRSNRTGANTFSILPALPTPPPPPTPRSDRPVKVPEIVVKDVRERDEDSQSYVAEAGSTATRTDTPLIQVPQSVGLVTQKIMQDQRALRVEQALRNVSGVALGDVGQSGIAADVAYCRGFPCGYFKNYLRNEDQNQVLTFRDVASLQRIEVLKGPASVLYGRSQPGESST